MDTLLVVFPYRGKLPEVGNLVHVPDMGMYQIIGRIRPLPDDIDNPPKPTYHECSAIVIPYDDDGDEDILYYVANYAASLDSILPSIPLDSIIS